MSEKESGQFDENAALEILQAIHKELGGIEAAERNGLKQALEDALRHALLKLGEDFEKYGDQISTRTHKKFTALMLEFIKLFDEEKASEEKKDKKTARGN